jgi:hypothetical protein
VDGNLTKRNTLVGQLRPPFSPVTGPYPVLILLGGDASEPLSFMLLNSVWVESMRIEPDTSSVQLYEG